MRQQYHFQPSERGLLAWDVNKLITLTKDFPVIEVPLAEIKELEEDYWFYTGNTKPTCKLVAEHAKLIQEVDMRYPILLFSDGRIIDGMHRVCRAYIDGKTTIKAVRFQDDPKPDYINITPENLPY